METRILSAIGNRVFVLILDPYGFGSRRRIFLIMNWLTISIDDLRAVALGEIIDTAQRLVVPGQADPVVAVIANAVATVRAAVATGNALDTEATTVPRSLQALTARNAAFALLERIEVPLTADQRNTRAADVALLTRVRDEQLRVEPADHPDGSGESPTNTVSVETVVRGNAGHGREELRGI